MSLAGKVIGGTVIALPAINAVQTQIGNPAQIPRQIMINYTGIDPQTGSFNPAATTGGVASIVGGLALMKVFSYVAKRF